MHKSIEVMLAITPDNMLGTHIGSPLDLKGDLARFKRLTYGNIVIMGKDTYHAIKSPLRDRSIIIVSKSLSVETEYPENVYFVPTLKTAFSLCKHLWGRTIFIAGGLELFKDVIKHHLCVINLTTIHKESSKEKCTVKLDLDLSDYFKLGENNIEHVYYVDPDTGESKLSHSYETYYSKKEFKYENNQRLDCAVV